MFSLLRFIRHFVTILLVLGFAQLNISLVPPPVEAHTDISFGEHPRQSMDIYYPRKAKNVKSPVGAFLFIHGGSWIAGSKEEYRMFAIPMAREGYVTATTAYRFIPRSPDAEGFTVADMMEDIGLAIAKLKETAAADGIEINKIALSGDSAGGHLALLYAYTHLNGTDNAPAIPIAFVIGRVAPTDVHLDDSMDNSVLNAVTADAPPTILCYATNDELVFPERHGFPLREKL